MEARLFTEMGCDISWLSAFPLEKEYLYPPISYLQPLGSPVRELTHLGYTFTIVEVRVVFP